MDFPRHFTRCLRWWTIAGVVVLSQATARADDFDAAVKSLLQASYDNLQTATDCETVIGASRYWEARAAVENALRAAGYSAATALSETDQMARRAEHAIARKTSTSMAECLADYTRPSKALLHQRYIIRDRQR